MLYIRTDINGTIATGHVMRCLSIADAARRLGEDITFILADENGREYIESRGFQSIILYTKWDEMEKELSVIKEVIEKYAIKTILIDSYQVTENYLKVLSDYVKTVYIDDLADKVYPATAIVCYMSHWEKLGHIRRYPNKKLLLGLGYVPVRDVFQDLPVKKIKTKVESILLLSGGTDPYDVLSNLLDVITETYSKEIIVICGKYYQNIENLFTRYKNFENIRILKSVENIEQYMQRADLAISAGGTTLYELCACGTPTISYAFADNQLENVISFAEKDIIEYAGDVRYDDIFERIPILVKDYCESVELRKVHSKKMQELVDGNGASHIVEEWKKLLELPVYFK